MEKEGVPSPLKVGKQLHSNKAAWRPSLMDSEGSRQRIQSLARLVKVMIRGGSAIGGQNARPVFAGDAGVASAE